MKNYSKMIDDVINKLDWDHIMKYYDNKEIDVKKKGRKVEVGLKNVFTIKKELKNLILFVIENNAGEIQHDNWIIYWHIKDSGNRLEIIFTPTRILYDDSIEDMNIEEYSETSELKTLNEMLDKSVKEENYELSAVIFSRIKRLKKSMRVINK